MNTRVLVVDDDRVIVELVTIILRSAGYHVQTARDGLATLKIVDESAPDLILLDYMLPEMNGLQVLGIIKEKYPDISVIILTGMGNEEIAVRAMKAGADDYIMKPFRNTDLLERVATVLRFRGLVMQNRALLLEREQYLHEIEEWNAELERRVAEKSRELELAQSEMIQVEKLATLGHLAAGLTHEIRNPLNSINLFAQILRNNCDTSPQHVDFLQRIQSEIDRIDTLLIKLLSVSRSQHRVHSAVQISMIAQEVLRSFQPQIDLQGISLHQEIAQIPTFFAEEEDIRSIFTNLIVNALHAMPEGGKLWVRVVLEQGSVKVEIGDNGCGIPVELQARVFDPFFTTRPKGTGFGLSIVLRIIKTYNGKILLNSQPGVGTTFTIFLPLTSSLVERTQ